MGQISIARGVVAIDPTSAPGVPLYTDVTSPQVLYSGTSGLISGSAKFQWINSTSSLEFGTGAEIYLYNTADQTTDYERGVVKWDTNAFVIGTEKGGTGSARTLNFQVDGTSRWYLSGSGHFLPIVTNNYDIGASGSLVRSLYYGTNLDGASGATFNLYNTADQTTNYERLRVDWSSNVARIYTNYGGSATQRPLQIGIAPAAGSSTLGSYIQFRRAATPFFEVISDSTGVAGTLAAFTSVATASAGSQINVAVTPTINQSGTASYTAFEINPTETATGSGTKLLQRWAVGGTQQAYMTNAGGLVASILVSTSGLSMGPTLGGADLTLTRDAADTLALRRSTNAQTFRVYNTYTDGSNYERGNVGWSGGVFYVGASAAGTGTQRATYVFGNSVTIQSGTGPTSRWTVTASGHFIADLDNAYNIGADGANRPKNVYVGTSIILPTSGAAGTGILSGLYVLADGITAPGAAAGQAKLYVDIADGDLKIIFGDGTIKTIVTDT